jgi:hypothetical protein
LPHSIEALARTIMHDAIGVIVGRKWVPSSKYQPKLGLFHLLFHHFLFNLTGIGPPRWLSKSWFSLELRGGSCYLFAKAFKRQVLILLWFCLRVPDIQCTFRFQMMAKPRNASCIALRVCALLPYYLCPHSELPHLDVAHVDPCRNHMTAAARKFSYLHTLLQPPTDQPLYKLLFFLTSFAWSSKKSSIASWLCKQ